MPTIEEELQDLLATHGETPVGTDRLGAVRRRIARRRQVTIAGATAAILLLAAAIPLAITMSARLGHTNGPTQQATSPAPNPTPPDPMGMLLPEFSLGFRRVAQATATFPALMQFELVYTPSRPSLVVDADCRTDPSQVLSVRVKDAPPESNSLLEVDCHANGSSRPGLHPVRVVVHGVLIDQMGPEVKVGQPMTLVVTLRPWASAEPQQVVHGSAVVGVYEDVPPADYPWPPRPAQLADLDQLNEIPSIWRGPPKPEQITGTLDSRNLPQPSGTFEFTVPMPAELRCAVDSVAPGELRFAVAGTPQTDVIFWDWQGRTSEWGPFVNDPVQYGIAVGDPLTITVTALHYVDHGWRIRCYDVGP